jgi:nickel transport protein
VSRRALAALPWLALAAAAGPSRAAAHETLHEVQRGTAIAVKGYFADGEVLAYRAYEVYSPADQAIPWAKGRTDRAGWLAFVPDVAGAWRVRVLDETGHGLDLLVDAQAPAAAPSGAVATWGFVLRPLLGLAVIAAVFAGLQRLRRPGRHGPGPPGSAAP